jgi:hypothetical protein
MASVLNYPDNSFRTLVSIMFCILQQSMFIDNIIAINLKPLLNDFKSGRFGIIFLSRKMA